MLKLIQLHQFSLRLLIVFLMSSVFAACGGGKQQKCPESSSGSADKIIAERAELRKEVNKLKRMLAQVSVAPATIKIDPSVLTIEGKPVKVDKSAPREGSLTQQQVISTLNANKGSLQPCYNRALKRDSTLHHKRIKLTLAIKIRPIGAPAYVAIKPNYNGEMTSCMKRAVKRWRFPRFTGSAVEVEIPATFKPTR